MPLVHGKPFATTAETSHHFITHHDDAVLGAQVTYSLQVTLGWNQNAVGADDGLETNHRNGMRTFHHEHILEMLKGALALFLFVRGVESGAIGIRTPELHGTGSAGFVGPTTWVTRERNGT